MWKIITLIFLILNFLTYSMALENSKFLSLKNDKVNVRYGPGFDFPIKFIYFKKFLPVKVENIVINSMGFILDPDKAAMWRGPMLSGAIKQLMESTEWGNLDYLFIDMSPGTGDAYLTVAKDLKPDAAILVTTNSELAIQDTLKSKVVFQKLNIPILGYVNNMVGSASNKNGEKKDITHILELNNLGGIPMSEEISNFNFLSSIKLFESIYNELKLII